MFDFYRSCLFNNSFDYNLMFNHYKLICSKRWRSFSLPMVKAYPFIPINYIFMTLNPNPLERGRLGPPRPFAKIQTRQGGPNHAKIHGCLKPNPWEQAGQGDRAHSSGG